jgi:hypothetical protein
MVLNSLPGAIQDQELMLEQKRLGNDGTGTARSEQASQGSDEMDEEDDQIAHHRILAGREIPMNYGRNNNSPATTGFLQVSAIGAEDLTGARRSCANTYVPRRNESEFRSDLDGIRFGTATRLCCEAWGLSSR